MLGILDLFDRGALSWTFEQLQDALGYPRSTLYRYLKTLTDAELLTSFQGVGYTLGPRITEFDYYIRTGDPLIRVARPIMKQLVAELPGVALLCRRYRQKVLCVHQESSTDTVHSNFERGLARPLLYGAASVVILAHLPVSELARLYRANQEEFAAAGYGHSLDEARARLKVHRQPGWMMTAGQVTPGVAGIAAPLFDAGGEVLGSLSLTVPERELEEQDTAEIARQILFCAKIITKTLAEKSLVG
jgi:DNA-binding IclR family transcriptional regulator